jgi:hypothetical protein
MTMKNNPKDLFKDDIRVLMLIDRSIGNSNKGSKRWINKIITSNVKEFDEAASALMALQFCLNNPYIRLYSSINSRKIFSAIKLFKHRLIDEEYLASLYLKLNETFVSCLMKPECRESNYFLLDCDSHDRTDVQKFLIGNLQILVKAIYPTPHGWHYIVEPFNPALAEGCTTFEVKKDALMLLNWLD